MSLGRLLSAARFPSQFSGGAAARGALLLAWLGISLGISLGMSWLVGCRRVAPAPSRLRFVRLDSLLPLHPSWQQILLLEREAAEFSTSQPRPDGIVLALSGLPSNFTPPQKVPQSLVAGRRRRLQEEATRYVDSYSEQLVTRNNSVYEQEASAARANVEATYQRELAERRNGLQAAADARVRVLLAERERLRFRLVALRSQIAAYTDQARADAVTQRERLNTDVAAIDHERVAALAAVDLNATEQMAAERTRLEADLARHLAGRRSALDQEVKDLTAREQARLSKLPDPIPALGTTPPPARYLHEMALPLPTPQQTLQTVQSAQTLVDARVGLKQAGWRVQRKRLVALIRADTQQAVEHIAVEQGWKLVPEGTPGAMDATQTAAAALRAQWANP